MKTNIATITAETITNMTKAEKKELRRELLVLQKKAFKEMPIGKQFAINMAVAAGTFIGYMGLLTIVTAGVDAFENWRVERAEMKRKQKLQQIVDSTEEAASTRTVTLVNDDEQVGENAEA